MSNEHDRNSRFKKKQDNFDFILISCLAKLQKISLHFDLYFTKSHVLLSNFDYVWRNSPPKMDNFAKLKVKNFAIILDFDHKVITLSFIQKNPLIENRVFQISS